MRVRVRERERERVETLIVGAGISGICMAAKLLEAGRTSLVVVEKSGAVGGTWSANAYPGCRCDVPSHLYSFSFHPNPWWTHSFAPRHHIQAYLHHTAAHHGVLPHVRFHTRVLSATWQDATSTWHVHAQSSSSSSSSSVSLFFEARFLVRATGTSSIPSYPPLIENRFEGTSFHSSEWPADRGLDIVRGRTVAVVGTGASAIQIVPEVAKVAKKLYVCQRTPSWILPRHADITVSHSLKCLLARAPILLSLLRWAIFIVMEFIVGLALWGGPVRPFVAALATSHATRHLRRSITDPSLCAALLPSYHLGCKRILFSNTFYPCLTLPHVELLQGSLVRVLPRSIVLSRPTLSHPPQHVDVDVIVYATGFDNWTPCLPIVGRHNATLASSSSASFLGITTHGFPNFFMLLGPNTGVGHTSLILMIEAQARYIISCMRLIEPPARALELRASSQKHFEDFLVNRFPHTVWHNGGCNSWYINPSTSKVGAIWPSSTIEYMYRTRSASRKDYHFR